MRFVCTFDTHTMRGEMPVSSGDVFIPAGDFTDAGSLSDVRLAAAKRVRTRYHVFGHIHEGYGVTRDVATTYVNACLCDEKYHPVHPPVVFDWERVVQPHRAGGGG